MHPTAHSALVDALTSLALFSVGQVSVLKEREIPAKLCASGDATNSWLLSRSPLSPGRFISAGFNHRQVSNLDLSMKGLVDTLRHTPSFVVWSLSVHAMMNRCCVRIYRFHLSTRSIGIFVWYINKCQCCLFDINFNTKRPKWVTLIRVSQIFLYILF